MLQKIKKEVKSVPLKVRTKRRTYALPGNPIEYSVLNMSLS